MFPDKGLFSVSKVIMILGLSWSLEIPKLNKHYRILYDVVCFVAKYYYGLIGISSFLAFVKMCMVNPDIAFESLSKTIFIFILFIKVLLCETKSMLEITKEFQRQEKEILTTAGNIFKQAYIQQVSFGRKLILCNAIACPIAGGQLILTAWWDAYNIRRMHQFDNETFEIPPATYLMYPFDERKHVVWALIVQTVAIISSTFAFRMALMGHLTAIFKILNLKLKNFGRSLTYKQEELSIKQLVIEHQDLIISSRNLNNSLKSLVLLEYCVSSIIFATTLLQILGGRKVLFHVMYFIIIYAHLFVLCLDGSAFLSQSVGLCDALYESGWYNLDEKTKSCVAFMMLRCQKPLSISIGPFGPLQAEAALSRIKIGYSYVTLVTGDRKK